MGRSIEREAGSFPEEDVVADTGQHAPGTSVMRADDREALRYAKDLLENPGLAAKLTGLIGMPLEKAMAMLPLSLIHI